MSTPANIPDNPTANQTIVIAGKTWIYVGNVWKRYNSIVSDGGYASTSFDVTEDGGTASGI